MPIPEFEENGLLPFGIHQCTLDDLESRFGCFQSSDRRPLLMQRLKSFLTEVRAAHVVRAIVVNGSFVTTVAAPNDLDILLVLPQGHDFRADLTPSQYLVVDRRRVRRVYGLDAFVVEDDSTDFAALVRLFHRVRLKPFLKKGILRIEL